MSDLISRQAAIDALRTCYDTETISMDNGDEYINYGDAVGEIEAMPSAQPEIIRCSDCKLFGEPQCLMFFDGYDWAEPGGYCHAAERRTDE